MAGYGNSILPWAYPPFINFFPPDGSKTWLKWTPRVCIELGCPNDGHSKTRRNSGH